MPLGDRLRIAREAVGLTQDELAVAIGRGRTTIYAWENDRTPIPKIMQARLRDYLRVDEHFDPLPVPRQSVTLSEMTDAELVSHMHVVAAEIATRLGTAAVSVQPGAAADIERAPGSVRVQSGGDESAEQGRSGDRGVQSGNPR